MHEGVCYGVCSRLDSEAWQMKMERLINGVWAVVIGFCVAHSSDVLYKTFLFAGILVLLMRSEDD